MTGLGIANEEGSAVFQFTDPAANSDQRFIVSAGLEWDGSPHRREMAPRR